MPTLKLAAIRCRYDSASRERMLEEAFRATGRKRNGHYRREVIRFEAPRNTESSDATSSPIVANVMRQPASPPRTVSKFK